MAILKLFFLIRGSHIRFSLVIDSMKSSSSSSSSNGVVVVVVVGRAVSLSSRLLCICREMKAKLKVLSKQDELECIYTPGLATGGGGD